MIGRAVCHRGDQHGIARLQSLGGFVQRGAGFLQKAGRRLWDLGHFARHVALNDRCPFIRGGRGPQGHKLRRRKRVAGDEGLFLLSHKAEMRT